MATNNAINLNAVGIAKYDGAGTFSATTVTNHSVIVGGASNALTSIALTNGQLAIGSTGADPTAAALTAGTGIGITNAAGSITINATGGGLSWVDVTGTTQAMLVNTGYLADNAGLVTLTLPATAVQFSVIEVKGYGAGGWLIAQNANQQIRFGSVTATTLGITGSLASTNLNDGVKLMAAVGGASTIWTVIESIGNITIV
jgi:hypothetical protein